MGFNISFRARCELKVCSILIHPTAKNSKQCNVRGVKSKQLRSGEGKHWLLMTFLLIRLPRSSAVAQAADGNIPGVIHTLTLAGSGTGFWVSYWVVTDSHDDSLFKFHRGGQNTQDSVNAPSCRHRTMIRGIRLREATLAVCSFLFRFQAIFSSSAREHPLVCRGVYSFSIGGSGF